MVGGGVRSLRLRCMTGALTACNMWKIAAMVHVTYIQVGLKRGREDGTAVRVRRHNI